MNSRSRSPLIWPPNRNDTSNLTSAASSAVPSISVKPADGAADALRRLKHGRRVHQRLALAGLGIFDALAQHADHRLAEREIAGGGERHDALAGLFEHVQLAEGRDVVEAGIGAGVGDHDETVAHQDSAAIGHGAAPIQPAHCYSGDAMRGGNVASVLRLPRSPGRRWTATASVSPAPP